MIHFGEKSEEGREGRKVFVVFVHQPFVLFHLHIVGAYGPEGVGVGDERPGLETPATNWRRRARHLAGSSVTTGDHER